MWVMHLFACDWQCVHSRLVRKVVSLWSPLNLMEMTWKWPGKLLPIEHLWEIGQMNNNLMFLCECGGDTPHFQWPKRKKNVRPPRTFLFITFLLHACHVTSVLSALCNPMDCSPPGSSVHGISQARILQWVVISFSRGYSQSRDVICISTVLQLDFLPLSYLGSPIDINIHEKIHR